MKNKSDLGTTTNLGRTSETNPTSHIAGHCDIGWEGKGQYKAQVTVREIELLCKYWAEEILRGYAEWAAYRDNGDQDICVDAYSWWRLSHFAEILGKDKVQVILDTVFKDFDPQDKPVLRGKDSDRVNH